MPTIAAPLLACDGLSVRCGRRSLVDGLHLQVGAGELLAITGQSGCGKSSLLRVFAGLDRPAAGTIRLAMRRRGAIAVAFQDAGLPGAITGMQAILAGRLHALPWWGGLRALPTAGSEEACLRADELGVTALLDRPVATASGGERQRLAIARALHHGGPLLLLDEPVSQLDPDTARRVMQRLRQEADAGVRAVIAVVHQPELVAGFADRELALGGDGTWTLRAVAR